MTKQISTLNYFDVRDSVIRVILSKTQSDKDLLYVDYKMCVIEILHSVRVGFGHKASRHRTSVNLSTTGIIYLALVAQSNGSLRLR